MDYNIQLRLPELLAAIEATVDDTLLDTKYVLQRPADAHKLYGHCYTATEALYHLWGKFVDFKPYVIRINETTTHWYLMRDGFVLDPTRKQFDFKVEYAQGKACGFLTKEPSKRTQTLINRIKKKNEKKLAEKFT